jgi:hypothetical protein
VLTVDTIPLLTLSIADLRLPIGGRPKGQSEIGNWRSEMSFGFLVTCVLTAATTEFLELETFRGGLLILRSDVVATLAICTL